MEEQYQNEGNTESGNQPGPKPRDVEKVADAIRAVVGLSVPNATEPNWLELFLAHLADPFVIIDTRMRLVYENDSAKRFLGDRVGELCHVVVEDSDLPCEGCVSVESMRDGLPRRMLKKNTFPDGSVHYMDVMSSPIMDDAGNIIACIELGRDVTLEKERESQKGDYLSMLSHDIKTPLTVIQCCSDLLSLRLLPDNPEFDTLLNRISNSVSKASRLVDDFLALSKVDSGDAKLDMRPARLSLLTEMTVEEFRPLAESMGVSLHTDLHQDLPDVSLDEGLFGRVISNILSNAIKYSGAGVNVMVRTGLLRTEPERLVLEVTDEGPGISDKDVPRIFDKFYRAESSCKAPGTGLGLSVVKAITELHGGEVCVESTLGRGTTVRLTLPPTTGTSTN